MEAESVCKRCATFDGLLICCISALFVMFRSVLVAGLRKAIISGLSALVVPGTDESKLLRASGGNIVPGTGGTFAHRLISPESLPWGSLLFAVLICGISAGVQFKFLSCFSGEESSESSNISSSLTFSAVLRLGEAS